MDDEVRTFSEEFARRKMMPVSDTLKKKLLFGAAALNYMGGTEPFKINREMVEDEKSFDKHLAGWYEEQARKIRGG